MTAPKSDYWLTLADDLRQVAERLAGLAGTAAPTWVRMDIVGVAPQDASEASATIIDALADVFGTEARTSDGGTVQRHGMGARHGVVDVNGYTYLPLEDSEVERLRAENAALLARLGVEKPAQVSDTGRCPICHHEAEHLHGSGCLARKDGVRCGCKHVAGGAR